MTDSASSYLFLDVPIGGPLEELRATFEKKYRMHSHLGEAEKLEILTRAYDLARAKLEAALAAPVAARWNSLATPGADPGPFSAQESALSASSPEPGDPAGS